MTEARAVLPTDLLALVSSSGRGYRNEAWPRERLGSEDAPGSIGFVKDQMLGIARGRQAWISVRRQRVLGLAGARRRGGRQAWEIDCLIDSTRGHDAVLGLIETAIAEVGRAGAEKLFVRLSARSALIQPVRDAGFLPYKEEVLYQGRANSGPVAVVAGLRRTVPSDSYLLYRFYNQATPQSIRRVEAATFNEWHAAQERRWLRNGVELLQERNGEVIASLRACRLAQGVMLDLLAGEDALADAESIVSAAVAALGAADPPVLALVPRAVEALARRLEGAGFEPKEEFVCFMRRTTRPQPVAMKPLPAIAAKTVVGA